MEKPVHCQNQIYEMLNNDIYKQSYNNTEIKTRLFILFYFFLLVDKINF